MKKLIYFILLFPVCLIAQDTVKGVVLEVVDTKEVPLSGANVFWLGSDIGDVTNFDGQFEVPFAKEYQTLVISYVGYKSDTISVSTPKSIRHVLKSKGTLEEVTFQLEKRPHHVLF